LYAALGCKGLRYRRFSKQPKRSITPSKSYLARALPTTSIEVDDERYDAKQIRALYENENYPLARKWGAEHSDDHPLTRALREAAQGMAYANEVANTTIANPTAATPHHVGFQAS
jgi:hypothetical protein